MRVFIFALLIPLNAVAACPEWWITWPHNETIYPMGQAPAPSYVLPRRADGKCVELVDLDFVGGTPRENLERRVAREVAESARKTLLLKGKAERDARKVAIDSANTVEALRAILKDMLVEEGAVNP